MALALGAWSAGPLMGAASARLLAPTYQSSSPEKDAMLDEAPAEVTITFSEPLDPSSTVTVVDECGKKVSGAVTVTLNELQTPIVKTPIGIYEVVYRAVGLAGATGTSNSSFEFMVHSGKPCGKKKPDHDHHDPKKKDHDNHDRDHEDRDHDDHDPRTDHTDHPTERDHSSMGHGSTDHDMPNGGVGHDEHKDHNPPPKGNPDPPIENPPLASDDTGGALCADAEAMLIGLGLALAVGVLGGWLLRMSGSFADPA